MGKLKVTAVILCFATIISSCGNQQKINAFHFQTKKDIQVKRGAVVSASQIASDVGVSI